MGSTITLVKPPNATPAQTVEAATDAVTKTDFRDQVEHLLTSVGPRITAAGAGLHDGRQLAPWLQGTSEPREDIKLARVAALAEVTAAIMDKYKGSVAAAFLRGSQPTLDDRSPMVMIREASGIAELTLVMGEVRNAVQSFLSG